MLSENERNMPSRYWREILIALAVMSLFTIFFGHGRKADGIDFQFSDVCMTISGPDGAPGPVVLDYADIRSISRVSNLEIGSCESGLDTPLCRFGTWHSSQLGQYTLCALSKVSEYIVLETAEQIIVINYENNDATGHLYTALVELLESKGMEVDADAG